MSIRKSIVVLFLPGSCKDAGFFTCCTGEDTCEGYPKTCYCDVKCHTLRDCCIDIAETCPATYLCHGEDEGNIRLGSIRGNNTRLEFCFNSLWGSLCVDDTWDDVDATVACRELGYITGRAFVADFGIVPSHVVSAECNGNDTSFANCVDVNYDDIYDPIYTSAYGSGNIILDQLICTTHAGLICEGCNNGDIRLRDGYVNGEDRDGRVEVCLNNTWGSLCSGSWDVEDASVACRQLGYSSENALSANFWPTFGTVHSRDIQVNCTGNETLLGDCFGSDATSVLPVGEVTCNSHAGVICEAACRTAGFTSCCLDASCFVSSEQCLCNSNMCPFLGNCCPDILFVESCPVPPVCNETDVRLVGGADGNSGRVEICLLGQWGTVCDRLWDDIDAAVVCRQLGLGTEGAFAVLDAILGHGDGRILLDQVACSGNESRLFDCRHRGVGMHSISCTSAFDAGVVCPAVGAILCTDGDVRLQDGPSESSGRVEVCFAGLWGTVCDDFWDDIDADVVCRQLGYNRSELVAEASESQTFPPGTGLIYLDNVDCTGDENNIFFECDHQPVGTSNCGHDQDAGVVCVPEFSGIGFEQLVYIFREGTTDNAVCITTNSTPLTGRVEIKVQSEDISAIGNSDYSGVSQRLTFTPRNNIQCIHVDIHENDMLCEIEESFLLYIMINTGERYAGFFRQNTTVIITDSGPIDSLYNFGPSAGDLPLLLQPNGKAPPLQLTQTFPFFGNNYSTIHVNLNGILSFETPVIEGPSPFPLADVAAVAPFWEVVEYSERDQIHYQESSQWCVLEKAYIQMQLTFTSVWNFFPTKIFTATWMVFEPGVEGQVHNTFQSVLATDGEMSFVTLYYDTIEWGNRDGVTAGLNAGDGITFEAPNTPSGSLTVDTNIGLGIMGVYVYRVDQFEILRPFECYNGDIRESERGPLEICVNNSWARLCAEFLGEREAAVACQQLGYSVGEDALALFSGVNEISIILLNDVNCSGGENSLLECVLPPTPLYTEGSCDYFGVNCTAIVISLAQEEYTVSEDGSLRVCAALNQTTSRKVIVRLATVESATPNSDSNQAKARNDYNTTAVEFVFEAKAANQLHCVDIPIIDDNIYEQNEVMLVSLNTPDKAVQLDPQYAFITILDNDVVTVQFVTGNYFVGEEATSLSVCMQKEGKAEVDINVMLNTMSFNDTTAKVDEDFPAISVTVTFSADSTVECRIVKVENDDIAFEENEQFILAVTSVQPNVLIGALNTTNVTIIDNDKVVVQFSSTNYTVGEDNGTVTVCMTKDLETARMFTATATSKMSESGFEAEENDFVPETVSFVFPPGSVNTICGEFQILSDNVALEGNEQFVVDLSLPFLMTLQGMESLDMGSFMSAANCTMSADVVVSSATITIIDTDVLTVNFSSEIYEASESDGLVHVCLLKDRDSDEDVLIHVNASELDIAEAVDGQDFASVSLNITFPKDQRRGCVDIILIDDSTVSEQNEQFMVQFTVITPGVETGMPNILFVTIIDNDVPTPGAVPQSSDSAIIGGTVAGVLAVVFLILIIVAVLYVIRRKKEQKYVPDQEERVGQNPYYEMMPKRKMSVRSMHVEALPPEMLIPSIIIRLLDSIGEGEFGVVYKGNIVHPMSTEMVAVKTLKGFFDQNQINDMLKESLKMWKFDHPNVMTLIGVCIDGGPAPYIVMPLMANGSLLSYLKKERSKLILPPNSDSDLVLTTSKKLMDFCIQAAKGMEYLASQKFVHKDLAARNCMIDLHFVIKIADFGLSENIYDRNYIRKGKDDGYKLPIKWMAIESLTDQIFSEKTDVWAYGLTVWEVFSGGKIPYPAVDPVSLPGMLQSGYRAEKPNNAACTDAMFSIMLECWKENPDERPTFSQLVSSISSHLEGLAGYLDVGMLGDWQTSDGDTNESAKETVEHSASCSDF